MKRVVSFGVGLLLFGMPAPAEAQDTEWNRYTLEDLGGVFVRFEVSDACDAVGVNAAAYQAEVSTRLMEADVGVLTQEEMLEHPAMPELRVSLDCAAGSNGSSGAMAYSVGLRVQQSAQMLRDTQITLPEAVTWFSTEIGVTSSGEATTSVGSTLLAEIEAFAEAWAAIHTEEGDEGGTG